MVNQKQMRRLAKRLETEARIYCGTSSKRPAMQVVFTFQGHDTDPQWIGNIDRVKAVGWLNETADDITGTHAAGSGKTAPREIDLRLLCRKFELRLARQFGGRVGLVVVIIALPPDYNYSWWVTNGQHRLAAESLRAMARKLVAKLN